MVMMMSGFLPPVHLPQKDFLFSSQKIFFQNKNVFKEIFLLLLLRPADEHEKKKKRGRGATVHWQSRRMQMTGCALGRLTKKKKEKKRNQSCWFPSSSCRLEKKKKSHFHLPTSAAGRLFISRLRSERHDPADKFQSSSFAYSSASSLFFILLCYLLFVCDRRRFQQRPPAGHQSPAEFYWPPNAVDIIRLARRRAASKGASFEYFNYLCTGMINLTPSIDKQLR